MKICRGLLIILLFQIVQRASAGFWSGKFSLNEIFDSKESKNDEEPTVVSNVWSTIVHGTSWLATEVKHVATISATKAKSILKWKDVPEGIHNNNHSSGGFFKDSWSYFNDKIKGFYSAIFTYKVFDAQAFTTGGFLKDSWSSYFNDKVKYFYSAIFTCKSSNVVAVTTDEDSQSQDTSFTGYIKSFWSSCTGWFNWKPTEECTVEWTPGNTDSMEQQLNELLYGQHLVTYQVPRLIRFHWHQHEKPLVLSLHGATGVGKNYVATLIVQNLFKLGEKSKFVTMYSGRSDFHQEKHLELYKKQLTDDLVKKIDLCDRHVFIFDEVDKIPMGLLDVLKPFIDYNMKVRDRDFRKTIFIFISNMGQNEINKQYMHLWKDGKKRADFVYSDFDKVLRDGVFNDNGGLRYSDNIKSHLIDLYIPFLPLEEEHVKRCIKFAFKKYFNVIPTEAEIEEVHKFVDYGPEYNPIFAKTGCKTLSSKVALIANYRRKRQDL